MTNQEKQIESKEDEKKAANSASPASSKRKYKALTPCKADLSKGHKESFKYALEDKSVRNIGITGPYGAGKSSLIRTALSEYAQNEKIAYVSLACLNNLVQKPAKVSEKSDTADTEKTTEKEIKADADKNQDTYDSNIEWSILQQLFYSVPPGKAPLSRFNRIYSIGLWDKSMVYAIVLATILFMRFVLSMISPSLYSMVFQPIDKYYQTETYPALPKVLSIIGLLLMFHLVCRLVIAIYSRIKNAESIKINDLEFAAKNPSESVLNMMLEEIIYFFDKTKTTILVIEDLDRFNDTSEIFLKLRELNSIINNTKVKKRWSWIEPTPIKFIYAVKDDLFKAGADRTKFFDFIIPVVPYITKANSLQKLQTLIQEANNGQSGPPNNITRDYMSDISIHIDDMRVLTNTVNEYLIYHDTLCKSGLQSENLFSLLVYKNLYPEDYALLCVSTGLLFKALNLRTSLIKELTGDRETKYDKALKDLAYAKSTPFNSVKDFRIHLWGRLHPTVPVKDIAVFINNTYSTSMDYSTFTNESTNIETLFQNTQNTKYRINGYSSQDLHGLIDCNSIFTDYNDISEVINMDHQIRLKQSEKISELESQIDKLKQELVRLYDKPLGHLFNDSRDGLVLKEFKKEGNPDHKDFIIKMISRGYIDDNYYEYLSYLHDGDLSSKDNDYLLNLSYNRPLKSDAFLNNPGEVLVRLNPRDCNKSGIFNFYLIEEMQQAALNIDRVKQIYDKTLSIYQDGFNEELYKFTTEYLQYLSKKKGDIQQRKDFTTMRSGLELALSFVKDILRATRKIGDYFSILPSKDIVSLYLWFISSEEAYSSLERLDYNNEIIRVLENYPDICAHDLPVPQNVASYFLTHKIAFKKVNKIDTPKNDLYEVITVHGLYELNEEMYRQIALDIPTYDTDNLLSISSLVRHSDTRFYSKVLHERKEFFQKVYNLHKDPIVEEKFGINWLLETNIEKNLEPFIVEAIGHIQPSPNELKVHLYSKDLLKSERIDEPNKLIHYNNNPRILAALLKSGLLAITWTNAFILWNVGKQNPEEALLCMNTLKEFIDNNIAELQSLESLKDFEETLITFMAYNHGEATGEPASHDVIKEFFLALYRQTDKNHEIYKRAIEAVDTTNSVRFNYEELGDINTAEWFITNGFAEFSASYMNAIKNSDLSSRDQLMFQYIALYTDKFLELLDITTETSEYSNLLRYHRSAVNGIDRKSKKLIPFINMSLYMLDNGYYSTTSDVMELLMKLSKFVSKEQIQKYQDTLFIPVLKRWDWAASADGPIEIIDGLLDHLTHGQSIQLLSHFPEPYSQIVNNLANIAEDKPCQKRDIIKMLKAKAEEI